MNRDITRRLVVGLDFVFSSLSRVRRGPDWGATRTDGWCGWCGVSGGAPREEDVHLLGRPSHLSPHEPSSQVTPQRPLRHPAPGRAVIRDEGVFSDTVLKDQRGQVEAPVQQPQRRFVKHGVWHVVLEHDSRSGLVILRQ